MLGLALWDWVFRARTYFVDDLRSRAGVQTILDVPPADAPRDHHDIVSLAVLVRHYLFRRPHSVGDDGGAMW